MLQEYKSSWTLRRITVASFYMNGVTPPFFYRQPGVLIRFQDRKLVKRMPQMDTPESVTVFVS